MATKKPKASETLPVDQAAVEKVAAKLAAKSASKTTRSEASNGAPRSLTGQVAPRRRVKFNRRWYNAGDEITLPAAEFKRLQDKGTIYNPERPVFFGSGPVFNRDDEKKQGRVISVA